MKYYIIISLILIYVIIFPNYQLLKLLLLLIMILFYSLLKKLTQIENKLGFKDINPSIMVIIGSGGHTWEMINLLSKLNWEKYLPTYIIGYSDCSSLNSIKSFENKYKRNFFYERIIRPREHHHKLKSIRVLFRSLYCFFKSFEIILRNKPDYILANGPSIYVPIILCAWVLKKLKIINTKIIYIESAARVKSLSISANLIKNCVDNMFGYWNKLCDSFGIMPINTSEIFKKNIQHSNKEKKNNKTVFITVGSTKFEKLIEMALKEEFQSLLVDNGYNKMILQIGNYEIKERHKINSNLKLEIVTFLSASQFENSLKNSDLVICHGGAATLLQSLINGKKPIAIANENVSDNHQRELIEFLQSQGYINTCKISEFLDFVKNNISNLTINNDVIYQFKLNNKFLDSIGEDKIIQQYKSKISNLNNKKLSIVIPSIYKDIYKLKNLLYSIHKYIPNDFIKQIYIIVPDNEVIEFSNFVFFDKEIILATKISIIKESKLIPLNTLNAFDHSFISYKSGWFKE